MGEVVALVVFGAIFGLVGLIFVVAPLKAALGRMRIARNGTRTRGRVIHVKKDDDMYLPLVEYTASDGRKREFEPSLWTNRPRKRGDEVEVVYDSLEPQNARLALERRDVAMGAFSVLCGGITLALGALAIVAAIRRPGEARRENVVADLIAAAERGDVASVQRMLASDRTLAGSAKTASFEDEGRLPVDRPLHAAARGLRPDVVTTLLKNGADVNATVNGGNTALNEAGSKTTFDDAAASARRARVLTILLAHHANVNAHGYENRTPLHDNAHDPKAVALLLAAGASIRAVDNEWKTPLHAAATPVWDNTDAVRMLVERGAKANVRDHAGDTPLNIAASNAHAREIEVLLAHGAPVDNANNEGATALHAVARTPYSLQRGIDALAQLCAHGARLDARDRDGGTPFEVARSQLAQNETVERKEMRKAVMRFVSPGGPCAKLSERSDEMTADERTLAIHKATCEFGSAYGCGMAGYLLDLGKGAKRDTSRAAAYYKQACAGGEKISCENLARLRSN